MKVTYILSACLLAFTLNAQDIPQKINVPPPHADPNVAFSVMHFDSPAKDQFSILYFYHVTGSVLTPGEFVRDTGQIVFKDEKFQEVIPNSGGAVLIKRQLVDINGKEISSEEHLLALRKLDPQNSYRLYFYKNVKDPMVDNRTVLTKSVYNVQQLPNMTEDEQLVLVKFCAQYIPVVPDKNTAQAEGSGNRWSQPRVVDDINAMKKQFKALHDARHALKGDLPREEKYQTRFDVGGFSYAVTRTKTDVQYLKFYVSEDGKSFECLDSAKLSGDVLLTSTSVVYNMNSQAVGAFTNFHYKLKDDKGEEITRQYSFVMDADFKIHGWVHSTGKDKLNSLAPEMCWFEGNKLYVLSDNRERVFKPYAQVHEFTMGGEAKLVFPATEEEKGTEKVKYGSTFQPPVPFNSGQVSPVPEKYVPLYSILSGGTRYFIAEGIKFNDVSKMNEYLTVKIYRFLPGGKLTNVEVLGDYRSTRPFPMTSISRNNQFEFFLLEYPIRVQLLLSPEKLELSQLTDDRNYLVQKNDGSYIQHTANGDLMLRKQSVGNKMELLYYP